MIAPASDGTEHDNRRIALRAERLADAETVHVDEQHIEDREIDGEVARKFNDRAPIARGKHIQPPILEHIAQRCQESSIVCGDEDRGDIDLLHIRTLHHLTRREVIAWPVFRALIAIYVPFFSQPSAG